MPGHPVFSLETLIEIPSCVLTDQKFPRSVILVLQITASHKTCYNRLIHCKIVGLEQAAHRKVSGWSWSRWSDQQSWPPPLSVYHHQQEHLGHPQQQLARDVPLAAIHRARATRSLWLWKGSPSAPSKALDPTLNPHPKATPLRAPKKISLALQRCVNLDAQEQLTGLA